jgi:hypothetical protein
MQPLAAPPQPAAVQRVRLEPPRHQVRDHGGEHERQDDVVVVGHLEHQQHARDRRVGGRRDHRAHPHQRIRLGPQAQIGEEGGERGAEGAACCGAHEQRRSEHAARSPAVQGDGRRENAPEGEQRERAPGHAAEDLEVHGEVPMADQEPLRQDHQDADQDAAQERDAPPGAIDLLDHALGTEEHPHEQHGHQPGNNAEERVEDEDLALQGIAVLLGNRERGVVPEEDV